MTRHSNIATVRRRGFSLAARVMLLVQLLAAVLAFAAPAGASMEAFDDRAFIVAEDQGQPADMPVDGLGGIARHGVGCHHCPSMPAPALAGPISLRSAHFASHWSATGIPAGLTVLPQPRPPKTL